ncbi:MAG: hypothetical protein ABJC39_01235 [Chloroflexota bacterium]
MTAIGWRAATAGDTRRPVRGAGTVVGVGMGVGMGTGVGSGVAVGTCVGVGAELGLGVDGLTWATGDGLDVAAWPPMDEPISATTATPAAIALTAPTVKVRFNVHAPSGRKHTFGPAR